MIRPGAPAGPGVTFTLALAVSGFQVQLPEMQSRRHGRRAGPACRRPAAGARSGTRAHWNRDRRRASLSASDSRPPEPPALRRSLPGRHQRRPRPRAVPQWQLQSRCQCTVTRTVTGTAGPAGPRPPGRAAVTRTTLRLRVARLATLPARPGATGRPPLGDQGLRVRPGLGRFGPSRPGPVSSLSSARAPGPVPSDHSRCRFRAGSGLLMTRRSSRQCSAIVAVAV
jgi:hypothetical protein